MLEEVGAEVGFGGVGVGGGDVGGEVGGVVVGVGGDGGLVDVGVVEEGLFDLGGFDADAADFELEIGCGGGGCGGVVDGGCGLGVCDVVADYLSASGIRPSGGASGIGRIRWAKRYMGRRARVWVGSVGTGWLGWRRGYHLDQILEQICTSAGGLASARALVPDQIGSGCSETDVGCCTPMELASR